MTTDIQQWRSALCQSLIAAGKTDAKAIIGEVQVLETFVFGKTETAVSQVAKAAVEKAIKNTEVTFEPVEEVKAQAAVEEQSGQAHEELLDAQPIAPAVALTKAEITAALMAVAKQSRDDLHSILNEINVEKVSQINKSDYPRVMQLAESALENANA